MKIEDYIIQRVSILMNSTDVKIVSRLEGGMSNYTYIVECEGAKYTYRVPGKYAERFVDRNEEWDNIQKIEQLGINNETIYIELKTGEKLAKYVEGTILSNTDIESYNMMSAKALKRLHNSDVQFKEYNAFSRLDLYEKYCTDLGFQHPQEYIDLRKRLDSLRELYKDIKAVPCHCDYQPTNLVVNGDDFYILDWEFAGMNDPYYDIACYGNAGFDKALSLLEAYLEHKPTSEELKRLHFHRAFQCLQWYNVATFKEMIGLSKDLNMDFTAVAQMFYGFAKDLIDAYDNL